LGHIRQDNQIAGHCDNAVERVSAWNPYYMKNKELIEKVKKVYYND